MTLGSDTLQYAGIHYVEVTCSLTEYKHLEGYQHNRHGIIVASLHQLVSDLTIPDVEYQVFESPLEIILPLPVFAPPLHASVGLDGESGSEFVILAELVRSQTNIVDFPKGLGSLNSQTNTLRIYCEYANFLGDNLIRITYFGQDYFSHE